MNKNPNINKYKNMSKDILYELGHTYRTDGMYDSEVIQECSYENYGLKITAYNLPGYVYEDKETGKLNSIIKNHMDNIRISYKNKSVFDSKNGNYKKGIWEDILLELYDKLDILADKKEEDFKNKKHCIKLMKEVIFYLCYKGVGKIDDSLKITKYSTSSGRIDNCGSFEDDHHYEVIKDGICVLHIVESDCCEYKVYSYTPGFWEYELESYLEELENKELLKDKEDGLEYIKQLRKLR